MLCWPGFDCFSGWATCTVHFISALTSQEDNKCTYCNRVHIGFYCPNIYLFVYVQQWEKMNRGRCQHIVPPNSQKYRNSMNVSFIPFMNTHQYVHQMNEKWKENHFLICTQINNCLISFGFSTDFRILFWILTVKLFCK